MQGCDHLGCHVDHSFTGSTGALNDGFFDSIDPAEQIIGCFDRTYRLAIGGDLRQPRAQIIDEKWIAIDIDLVPTVSSLPNPIAAIFSITQPGHLGLRERPPEMAISYRDPEAIRAQSIEVPDFTKAILCLRRTPTVGDQLLGNFIPVTADAKLVRHGQR